jgi:acyl carrier protein
MNSPDDTILDQLRTILREQGTLPGGTDNLAPDTDLYAAGLTSLASVDLMLAIEQNFGVSFPDEALSRRTFSSIGSIAAVIERLMPQRKS